jgi:hypothetical protein
MERNEIERLINQSIKRLKDEYELLNITLLNALHRNIDIMIENAEKWFGDNIPQDFRDALSSLMTLTYLYCQENPDFSTSLVQPQYEEFKPDTFINTIIADVETVLGLKNVTVELQLSDATIRTSRKILRDALLNIFLSMAQFMQNESKTKISLKEEPTTIRLALRFDKLASTVPDMSKLSRVVYSHFDGSDYRINIGLSVALENLRNIGVMVKVARIGTDSIEMNFSIPTTHFLETINQIQKQNVVEKKSGPRKKVLLCIDDVILEMVLTESLQDAGFSPARGSLAALRAGLESRSAIITDSAFLTKNIIAQEEIEKIANAASTVIIIYGRDETIDFSGHNAIFTISKPFEIDAILKLLE